MLAETTKRCFKCGETRPLSYFYKHPRMADGHVNKCKECNKKDVRENYQTNNDYYSQYDKDRLADKSSERNRKKKEYSKQRYVTNPDKSIAQYTFSNAVRDGKISRCSICEFCGSNKNIHAHHSSYSEDMRLSVTWLCGKCHVRLHKDFEYKLGPWSDAI